jgi:hypothetical protein
MVVLVFGSGVAGGVGRYHCLHYLKQAVELLT